MPKNMNVTDCYNSLTRNGHVIETPGANDPQVMIIKTRGNVGIKMWGIIDYLCNHKAHYYHGGLKK